MKDESASKAFVAVYFSPLIADDPELDCRNYILRGSHMQLTEWS